MAKNLPSLSGALWRELLKRYPAEKQFTLVLSTGQNRDDQTYFYEIYVNS